MRVQLAAVAVEMEAVSVLGSACYLSEPGGTPVDALELMRLRAVVAVMAVVVGSDGQANLRVHHVELAAGVD